MYPPLHLVLVHVVGGQAIEVVVALIAVGLFQARRQLQEHVLHPHTQAQTHRTLAIGTGCLYLVYHWGDSMTEAVVTLPKVGELGDYYRPKVHMRSPEYGGTRQWKRSVGASEVLHHSV